MKRLTAIGLITLMLGPTAWADPIPDESEVRIFSDSLRLVDRTGVVQFEGNVQIEFTGMTMSCDQLTVRTSQEDPSKVLSGTATGHVAMNHSQDRIEAGEARFDLERSTVDLTDSPSLFRGQTTIHAERIVYLLDEGTATFYGPVRAVFVKAGE